MKQGIEKFIAVVSHCPDHDKVLEVIRQLQMTSAYKCPTASVFALHVILDLYDEGSSDDANITHITTRLEAVAQELLQRRKKPNPPVVYLTSDKRHYPLIRKLKSKELELPSPNPT
jgi:hypothetical protein